jgi:hypothetical protein
MKYPFLSPAEE